MQNPQPSVEIRTPTEEEERRTRSHGRYDRRRDAQDRTSVDPIVAIDDAGGSRELRRGRSRLAPVRSVEPIRPTRTERPPTGLGGVEDRQRLERDLHDGVQNELVALIVKLALAQDDPDTPPALAHRLAELEAHAQGALDSVRDVARGIYPPLLADFGLREALRAQAARAAITASLVGTAPRSTEQAEQAVYFACSEAIQNAAKHAGRSAQLTLRLDHHHDTLRLRIADDGRGFNPARTPEGAGLHNLRQRIEGLGGSLKVTSRPGFGTVLTISLPWLAAAEGRR